MPAECSLKALRFGRVAGRDLVADFGGGAITSNGGALLLRQVAQATGLIGRLAACFNDNRSADRVAHELPVLLGQRVFGLALGFEDLNDHDDLRKDPLLAACLGQLGAGRRNCEALAGRNTLNRLEHSPNGAPTRYHRIAHDGEAMARLLVELFLDAHSSAPNEIMLDVDASDLALHGDQEGKFFHGYYGHYCYLPLYVFCGQHILAAKLRPANCDAAAGSLDEVRRIVWQIRERWPEVRIILRADSGFARDEIMGWCEEKRVDYVIGLARNSRLVGRIEPWLNQVLDKTAKSGRPSRDFAEFAWSTRDSWSRERRVIAKAEALPPANHPKPNPRFIVTSLDVGEYDARALYENVYCARGDDENRIKDQQLDLFGTRVSAATLHANQLRLYFSAFAYTLIKALQRIATPGTALAKASPQRIRLSLLKLGAQITISTRRIRVTIATACPRRREFETAHARLAAAQKAF